MEIELVGIEEREYILKNVLERIKEGYDYIMDCPPSLSMLTINALTAADSVLVPIQCEYYALKVFLSLFIQLNWFKRG